LPEGPLPNLTDLCERAGILVVWCDLEKGIDGVSMTVRDLPPCIFLNRHVPPDRMRFSLAHELGHAIMHRIPTDHIEDEANAFASELLLPEKALQRALIGHRVSLELLARMKAYWRVSMASILYRMGQLGIITRHQSEYMWKKLSALGWRTREPQETDFPYEEPTVFPKLLRLHSEDLEYDLVGLQALLHTSTEDLLHIYGNSLGRRRPGLYAVK
jgi:Zn-dependent peptidase ImmA (M78 family)